MKQLAILLLIFPLILSAGTLQFRLFFDEAQSTGSLTATGRLRVPMHNVNILLPAGATPESFSFAFCNPKSAAKEYRDINPAWLSETGVLTADTKAEQCASYRYRGLQRWGDLHYITLDVLPYDSPSGLWYSGAELSIRYSEGAKSRNYIPATFHLPQFFVNQAQLFGWYRQPQHRNYDYLVIGKPELYNALGVWQTHRSNQGFTLQFADIDDILATSAGVNDADKLRNYLKAEYDNSPFTYLLLLGDYDTVPVAYLTPEPGGSERVPSDFFYSDLSSDWDTNNNGLYGEYSAGTGQGDWGIDFTPELYVGRFSTNIPAQVQQIGSRVVFFENNGEFYRNKVLLPSAYANYENEPEYGFGATNSADFAEYLKDTILRDYLCTTLYEQEGVVPSPPSDYDLNYNNLKLLINEQDFGIINWCAHGSEIHNSRKIWNEDSNNNGLPDSGEMRWRTMTDKQSFDNISSIGGSVIFAHSCYNGCIDSNEISLAEYALIKKGVGVLAATRTGWYKPGWENPGWGGLASYNYHFLENYAAMGLSLGAAHAFSNLMHSQYYLFGDPLDSDGIIWPELQNIYTFLLYGDPAIGHSEAALPEGEILVFTPGQETDYSLINVMRDAFDKNIVHSNRLIPDYDYISSFEGVFAIIGEQELEAYQKSILIDYLASGGKLYIEKSGDWELADPLYGLFDLQNVGEPRACIRLEYGSYIWDYVAEVYELQALDGADMLAFWAQDANAARFPVGIRKQHTSGAKSLASGFKLQDMDIELSQKWLIEAIAQDLGIIKSPESAADAVVPTVMPQRIEAYPNPSRGVLNLRLISDAKTPQELNIYNLKGQRVKSIVLDAKNGFSAQIASNELSSGVYIIKSAGARKKISIVR